MNTPFSQESQDTPRELLLRATLRAHAPQTIDLEQGWEKISARLYTLPEQVEPPRGLRWFPRQMQGERRFVKRWPVFAVAAVLLVALVVAGLVGPFASRLGGNQPVYAQVNQVQNDQGIALNLTRAYASLKGTYLLFKVTIPPALAKDYQAVLPADSTLTYQHKQDRKGQWPGLKASPNGSANEIAFMFSPLNPPADAQQVTLTWQVTRLQLQEFGSFKQGGGQSKSLDVKGNWTFTFTIPFHHDYSASLLPDGSGPRLIPTP